MQLMILVDDAGGVYARIDHSPWNGCTLADFVMPFFFFIVGVAISLALKVHIHSSFCFLSILISVASTTLLINSYILQRIPKVPFAIRKVILRTLKLLFWGILLQGGYSHAPDDLSYGIDMKIIRWCGILQVIITQIYFKNIDFLADICLFIMKYRG